jgi:uncharacterized protein YhbP (UPF0306 family)
MDVKKLIQAYLNEAKMMHLATVSGNQPWVCNVWFASDKDLNIYWLSSISRRHSVEVQANNLVSGGITTSLTPEDKPRGLQFQGVAEKLTREADVEKAVELYKDRIFPEKKIRDFMTMPDKPHNFYLIKPTLFVLFDVQNFPENPRQEWKPDA